jgi:hypothetical protein
MPSSIIGSWRFFRARVDQLHVSNNASHIFFSVVNSLDLLFHWRRIVLGIYYGKFSGIFLIPRSFSFLRNCYTSILKGFIMKDIIKEILPLVELFYSCVGREREKKIKQTFWECVVKEKQNFYLKKIWIFERRLFHLFQKLIFFGVGFLTRPSYLLGGLSRIENNGACKFWTANLCYILRKHFLTDSGLKISAHSITQFETVSFRLFCLVCIAVFSRNSAM